MFACAYGTLLMIITALLWATVNKLAGYRWIKINILAREFDFEIARVLQENTVPNQHQTVITNRRIIVILKTKGVYKEYKLQFSL